MPAFRIFDTISLQDFFEFDWAGILFILCSNILELWCLHQNIKRLVWPFFFFRLTAQLEF